MSEWRARVRTRFACGCTCACAWLCTPPCSAMYTYGALWRRFVHPKSNVCGSCFKHSTTVDPLALWTTLPKDASSLDRCRRAMYAKCHVISTSNMGVFFFPLTQNVRAALQGRARRPHYRLPHTTLASLSRTLSFPPPRSPLTLKHGQNLPTAGHLVGDLSRVPPPDYPTRCTFADSGADFVLKELPASFLGGVVPAELLKSVEVEVLQAVHPGVGDGWVETQLSCTAAVIKGSAIIAFLQQA